MAEGDECKTPTEVLDLRLGFLQTMFAERMDRQDEMLRLLLAHIEGNGSPGIKMDVDRLKQWRTHCKVAAGTVLAAAVSILVWLSRGWIKS